MLLEDRKNENVLFDLNIDGQYQTKRISSKILNMDENNQYGMAMRKPWPYGCIKKKGNPSNMIKFNRILNNLSHKDSVGHIFIIDIKFHNVNPKTMLFNELYHPVFKKDKKMDSFEHSTLQLLSTMVRDENKDKIDSIRYDSKTHSTLREKKFIPFCAEDLHFLITRTGWLVTHIYEHFTFKQSKFKKYFVVMNQKSRQKATSSVERDFYKLLKNSNFCIDCRNNIENCVLEPLFNDFEEIFYIKKFTTIFNDDTFRDFFLPPLLREEIIQTFQEKIFSLEKNYPYHDSRKQYYENQMQEELDGVYSYEKNKKAKKKCR